jgi:hypothetical protein
MKPFAVLLFSEQLDQVVATSRKSLQGAVETDAGSGEAVQVFNRQAHHREHQQADKKKKKKKKQKQKEKLKAKDERALKLKVKGEEEIRREELEKAGLLPSGRGNGKGYWTETSKEHTKGKSVQILDSENTRDRNQNGAVNSDEDRKQTESNEWPIRAAHTRDNMSSIDSAIAYLSQPQQVSPHLKTNRLPISPNLGDVPHKYDWTQSLKDNGLNTKPINSWPKSSADWLRDKNRLFGSVSNAGNSHRKADEWMQIPSVSESAYREMGRTQVPSRPIGKDSSEDRQHFTKTVPDNRLPHLGASVGKDMPGNTWKESQANINKWPKEERRYFSGNPVDGSPNTRWSRFSVESLKHGNLAGNVKMVPELPIDQTMSSNRDGYRIDNWPNFPPEAGVSIQRPVPYSWPKYSDEITNQNGITVGKPSLDPTVLNQKMATNRWSQIQPSLQKPLSAIDTAIEHHRKEVSNIKQWPHFAYHRVTSSPQILVQQQKEAQQRARYRSAYIAVSVVAPPGKSKGLNKTQSRTTMNATKPSVTPLPDKMDQLLALRSEKQNFPEGEKLLEEQLVDLAVARQQSSIVPWSHARHLDKIQVFVSFGTLYRFCL